MSGPKDGRGADAFDDFFGDPTPSGHMGPTREVAPTEPEDEPTQDVELRRRGEPTQATPVVPPITPEPTPSGAVPEDWWQPEPQAAPPAAPAPAAWQQAHAAPAQQAYAQQPQAHQPPRREPGRGVSPAGMVGMLVGGVLVGGLCVGGAVMALNSGDDEPVATSTTVTSTSTSQPTTSTSTSSSTSSSSSSSTTTVRRTGKLPDGVTKCAGPKQGTSVGRGSEVTSCAFAGAVRDAYLAEDPTSGSTKLEVRSPVTKKNYTMTCTGSTVTRCTGGNDAVVVLY